MLEPGPGALITDSASGSLSGIAGLLGQMPEPAVTLAVGFETVSGAESAASAGISGVGAGMTESGKTALTTGSCFKAASCAEVTEAATNGSALPNTMFVAPARASVRASGLTSPRTTRDLTAERASRRVAPS